MRPSSKALVAAGVIAFAAPQVAFAETDALSDPGVRRVRESFPIERLSLFDQPAQRSVRGAACTDSAQPGLVWCATGTGYESAEGGTYTRTFGYNLDAAGRVIYVILTRREFPLARANFDDTVKTLGARYGRAPTSHTFQGKTPDGDEVFSLVAYWGDIKLVRLSEAELRIAAQAGALGRVPLVDHRNDVRLSARQRDPVYKIEGKAGFIAVFRAVTDVRTDYVLRSVYVPGFTPEPNAKPEAAAPKPAPEPKFREYPLDPGLARARDLLHFELEIIATMERARRAEEDRVWAEQRAKREEAERKAAEARRIVEEQKAAEERARRQEEERKAAEARRIAEEKAAEERRLAEEKARREAAERAVAEERARRIEAERKAIEARRLAEERARREEAERKAAEAKRIAEERARLEEAERKAAAERRAIEERFKKAEAEYRAALERAQRAEAERKAAEERARQAEEERRAAEERARRIEAERKAAEERRNEERRLEERRAAEERARREEAERKAAAERRATEERLAAEERRASEERRALDQKRVAEDRRAEDDRRAREDRRAAEEERKAAEERKEAEAPRSPAAPLATAPTETPREPARPAAPPQFAGPVPGAGGPAPEASREDWLRAAIAQGRSSTVQWVFERSRDRISDDVLLRTRALFPAGGRAALEIAFECNIGAGKRLSAHVRAFDERTNAALAIPYEDGRTGVVRGNVTIDEEGPQTAFLFPERGERQASIVEIPLAHDDIRKNTPRAQAWLRHYRVVLKFRLAEGEASATIYPYAEHLRRVLEACAP